MEVAEPFAEELLQLDGDLPCVAGQARPDDVAGQLLSGVGNARVGRTRERPQNDNEQPAHQDERHRGHQQGVPQQLAADPLPEVAEQHSASACISADFVSRPRQPSRETPYRG